MRDQFRYMLKIGKIESWCGFELFQPYFLLSISNDSGELGIFKSDRNRYSLASPISVFALISACCVFENYFPALSAMPQMLEHFLRAYRTLE